LLELRGFAEHDQARRGYLDGQLYGSR
jgi:hypothetical protein